METMRFELYLATPIRSTLPRKINLDNNQYIPYRRGSNNISFISIEVILASRGARGPWGLIRTQEVVMNLKSMLAVSALSLLAAGGARAADVIEPPPVEVPV